MAEDRGRFDALLEHLNIRRPKGMSITTLEEALDASEALGFPVLLRPSYVIGGQNMVIAHGREDVEKYMKVILPAASRTTCWWTSTCPAPSWRWTSSPTAPTC